MGRNWPDTCCCQRHMRKRGDSKASKKKPPEVVRLEDLAPRKGVKGGGRRVFGERPETHEEQYAVSPEAATREED